MSDSELGERKLSKGFQTFIGGAFIRLRIVTRHFFRDLTLKMRWTLIVLSSIVVLASVALFILAQISSSSNKIQVSKNEIAKNVSTKLHSVVLTLSNLRDTLGTDSVFVNQIENSAPPNTLFETIYHLDSLLSNKFSDVLPYRSDDQYSVMRGRGVAYYDPDRHLTAWNSTATGTANFDSVFSFAPSLEKHSKSILIENEQMFSWLTSIRKIISKNGALLGYITAKSIIRERFSAPGTTEQPLTIFDDIIAESGRDVRFFTSPAPTDSAFSKGSYTLLLDPTDSSTIAGYLLIGDPVAPKDTHLLRIVTLVRDIVFVILVLVFFWIVCWAFALFGSKSVKLRQKFYSIGSIFLILCIERLLLLATSSLTNIIPLSLQDSQDFALPFGFGILSNPLQLFTTILFLTGFLTLVWVIYVPEKPDWKPSSKVVGDGDDKVRSSTTHWLMKIGFIVFLMLLLPLANFLFASMVSLLVTNGSYHYLENRFGFSRGSFVLMEATFLLLGLSYFFAALMITLATLRAMIRMTVSELSPSRSYIAHYIFFVVLSTLTGWFLSPPVMGIYPEIYWLIICCLLCLVTIVIFMRDLAMIRAGQKASSLFYRIPRSGLAILFLLSAAGFLLSPLISINEYANNVEIVKENLKENSQANDLNYSSFLDQTLPLLSGKGTPIALTSAAGSPDFKNFAFNIWLKYFSETTNRNVVIEVQDIHHRVLSHFSQNATLEDEGRLTRVRDSLFKALLNPIKNDQSQDQQTYLLGTEPCFTSSCTPASIGICLIASKPLLSRAHDSSDSSKLLLSISMWNDPFHQTAMHSLYEIVHPSIPSGEKLSWQNQEVMYAQYINGTLLNSSSSVIEVPPHISSDITKGLLRNEFVSHEELIDGKRSFVIYHAIGDSSNAEGRLIAATLAIPGAKAFTELSLSLNTVSLFVGFFVIFFALILRSLFSKGKSGTLKFRDRIFLIVLTIALIPLVIVTNITRSLLIEREQRVEREHLQRDADIISERLQRSLLKSDSSRTGLDALLGDLSHTIGRDISLYTERGILRATNRPELYESSVLANQLSSQTVREMMIRQKSFTIEPLASASGSFDIGYKAMRRSGSDGLLGIVGVTSFRGMQIIEADIAQTIELMYGAFAALGIILLLIGAWISVRVAAPIQQLIAATERVTEGRLETIVDIKRKDEVGELAQAFNRMTAELERSKENVAQSEREGAWKEMARQVAHEIKNPLTPMKLSVQHIEHAYESGDTNFGSVFKRVIRTLSEQIDVLTRIATEFSRFGEMPRRKYGFVSLTKIVESAVALYDAERVRIRFVIDIPKKLPFIYADDEAFRRALVNLIRNALQATEGWGVILISAREKNGLIHLKLSDTGGGMSEETLKKAFDPNFSTKTSGMGLGLAIVKKIITDMSGTISVESTLGKGTTFHIDLPAREDRENNV